MSALYQRARTPVLGRYEQERAVEFLRTCVETMPAEADGLPGKEAVYWRMDNAYGQLDRADEARDAYERSLRIKKSEQVRQSLKSLGEKR